MFSPIQLGLFVFHCCVIWCVKAADSSYAADLILLVDDSYSVNDTQMDIVQGTMKKLPKYLNISADEVHVGVVIFSNDARIELPLTGNETVFTDYLEKWQRPYQGGTNTHFGLEKALEALKNSTRPDVPKHVVLLTDGISRDDILAESMAETLRKSNISIFILYVGVAELLTIEHMRNMAANPDRVYAIENYEKFLETFKKIMETIVEEELCSKCTTESCPAQCITTGPTTLAKHVSTAAADTEEAAPQQSTDDAFQHTDSAETAEQEKGARLGVGKGEQERTNVESGVPWVLIGGVLGGLILLALIVAAVLIVKKKKTTSASVSKQSRKKDSDRKKPNEKSDVKNLSDGKLGSGSLKVKLSGKEKAATGSNMKGIEQSLQVSLRDRSCVPKSLFSQGTKNSDAKDKEKVTLKDAKAAAKGTKAAPEVVGKAPTRTSAKSANAK